MEVNERILVIRLSSLGDILLTSPAIRALRQRFPKAQIDFLVSEKFSEAASLIPHIDRVISLNTKNGISGLWEFCKEYSRSYSLLIDLQNSYRSLFLRTFLLPTLWIKAKRYRFKRWLLVQFKWNFYKEIIPVPLRYGETVEEFGGMLDNDGLILEISDEAQSFAETYLQRNSLQGNNFIVVSQGAKHFTKRWPKNKWLELGKKLADKNCPILVVGSIEEKHLVNEIASEIEGAKSESNLSIQQIAAVMKKSKAVISNDSGLMHLASGIGVPHVAIFGPTVEEFGFYPYKSNSIVLENKMSCRPCSAMGSSQCPRKHFKCMNDTMSEHVIQALNTLTP